MTHYEISAGIVASHITVKLINQCFGFRPRSNLTAWGWLRATYLLDTANSIMHEQVHCIILK
jgi:hypothetical protein